MFKKLLQLKTLLVALLVMTGAGNVWADEELYYTLTPATGSNNSYTGNCDVTISGITWNIVGNSQMVPWRIGGKSIKNQDRTVYSKTAMASAISKVKLEVGAASSITVNSLKLIVASDANFNTKIDEVTATFTENSTITFTPSSPGVEWATDAYYKFVFNVTVSGNSNKFVEFKSAKFYHQDDSTPVPTHTATFSVNGATTTQDFNEGANIIFPANPDDINDKTFVGWVTDAIEGTTDTAPSFVTSATMGSSDVTYYAVFANREGGVNSVTDELDRAFTGVTGTGYSHWSGKQSKSDAVYAGQSAGGNSSIQLRSTSPSGIITTASGGTLSKVTVTWNSNTSANRTLNVYGSNTAYKAAADLYDSSKQGTLLGTIVYGTSTELTVSGDYAYVGLRSDNGAMYLGQVDITWSVSSNTYSAYCTSVIETPKTATTLTIDATGLTNTDVYVSTAAGALAATVRQKESNEPVEDVTVTWTSSNTDVATIAADGTVALVAAGTTTLTATYAGNNVYEGSTDTYELTVTDSEPVSMFVKVSSMDEIGEGYEYIIVAGTHVFGPIDSNKGTNATIVSFDNDNSSICYVGPKSDARVFRLEPTTGSNQYKIYSVTDEKYLNNGGEKSTNLSWALNSASSWTFPGTYSDPMVVKGSGSRALLYQEGSTNKFGHYATSNGELEGYYRVQLYRKSFPLSVSAAGYATFSSTSALDFTNVEDIIHAYTATVNGDAISFTRVNKVPANTGLLLRSVNEDAVSTRVPLYDGATYDVTEGNAFVAATTEIPSLPTTTTDGNSNYTNYILNKPSGGSIGFYQANGQKVGAGKAYLRVSSKQATTRAFIAFSFDDPETGVAQVETLPQQGVAYDLQGRRINAPKGGLYIINGKKVIVK